MSKSLQQKTIDYYRTRESRWGYRLVLGGTKHFGYYPEGRERISMRRAMRLMEGELGRALGLPEGALVLDAGCGMGRVATHLSQDFGYRVEGIDLLDFNVEAARTYARRQGAQDNVAFQVGDYTKLPFPDASFDGLYTMETLYHAPDYDEALSELRRVLKPGGRIALFEYSVAPLEQIDAEARRAFEDVAAHSAMHSFPPFIHGEFNSLLSRNGFVDVETQDITLRVEPMLRRFAQLGAAPYKVQKAIGRGKHHYVNAMAGYEIYKHRKYWRYNIVTARKAR